MAEQQEQQDRTEQPTQKRLDDSRRKGQLPRSRELGMAAVMLTGALTLMMSGGYLAGTTQELMVRSLTPDRALLTEPALMARAFSDTALSALFAFTPLMAALAVAAVLGTVSIGGLILSPAPLAFKGERISPIKGLKRIFSLNSLMEVAKALLKALLIGGIAVGFLVYVGDTLLNLSSDPLRQALGTAMSLCLRTLLLCSVGLLLIAAIDAPYQLWSHRRQLRMSRREVTDEMKETEGRPEVRGRIRRLQQEVAQRRMMADVETADVIVTNPTHFAVALRYDEGRMRAPVVVAKGVDHVAARIRAVGEQHRVTHFESPMLARALYWTTDIGSEIPAPLYVAVAQVLTYVYRLRTVHDEGGEWPERPGIDIDPSLARKPGTGDITRPDSPDGRNPT